MYDTNLLNIARSIYPEGISELENLDAYNDSTQHQNLVSILHCFDEVTAKSHRLKEFISEFREIRGDFHFHDVGRFQFLDRCLNYQLTMYVDGFLHSLCINISVVVPYYVVYALLTEVEESNWTWKTRPIRSRQLEETYKDVLDTMGYIAEKHFITKKIPDEHLDVVLPNISRGFIGFGKFNFFNAFFLDEYYTLL